MMLARREAEKRTKEQAILAGLVAALTWEHPKEKEADPIQWAPRIMIYPEEAERVMEKVVTGKWHTLPPELELIGQRIANPREGWTRNVSFDMLSYEEARKRDPRVDSLMLLPENAAVRAHGFVCEDGPELLNQEEQDAAQDGGEVLEGVYSPGCVALDQAKISMTSGTAGTGVGTQPVVECTGGLGGRIGIQSIQERVPTPVPSDNEE
jgi:hypothetical protein